MTGKDRTVLVDDIDTSDSDTANEFFDSDEYNKNVTRPSLEPAKLRVLQQHHNDYAPNSNNSTTNGTAEVSSAPHKYSSLSKPLPAVPSYAIPTSTPRQLSANAAAQLHTNPAIKTQTISPSKQSAIRSDVPVYASISTAPSSTPAAAAAMPTTTTAAVTRPTTRSSAASSAGSSAASSPNTSLRQPIPPVQVNTPHSTTTQLNQHSTPVASHNTTFKNLDTGESYRSIDEMKQKYPEILTIDAYDLDHRSESSSRSQSRNQSVSTPTESDREREHSDNASEKRSNLGYKLGRMFKQALNIGGDDTDGGDGRSSQSAQTRSKVRKKVYQELTQLNLVQTLNEHNGPIWTFAVSHDGQFIATGGQDSTVRVWSIMGSAGAAELDEQLRQQLDGQHQPTTPSDNTHNDEYAQHVNAYLNKDSSSPHRVIHPMPYRVYIGHKADIVDLAWSKANFLLSASIDKTVRLWHISRPKCLCLFQHSDFVTAVSFHPVEDRYFLSASFDKKLRVWNIPEHRVVEWTQTSTIITACAFSPNGQLTVAGLYNGQCIFYATDGLKYYTQVECRNRHGKYKKGKKVTGLQFTSDGKQLLVTTNDSRIRLYDMDDYRVVAKFKGAQNDELQIRAYFDETARYIICGSENECVYIWNTQNASGKIDAVEYFKACQDTVTCSRFMPRNAIRTYSAGAGKPLNSPAGTSNTDTTVQHCIIAAGYNGELKVFENTGLRRQV